MTANQSPVATRPRTGSQPMVRSSAAHRSGAQVGNSVRFTVETIPRGSPAPEVSTSCWTNSRATTRVPVGRLVAQPAMPAFKIRSTPYFRQKISAAMAAFTLLTPPTQAVSPSPRS